MQSRRGILFLALAILLGIAAAWVAQRWLAGQAGAPGTRAAVDTVPVVVARLDLSVATTLDEVQLGTVDWPSGLVPDGALNSVDQAVGRVLRRPVVSSEAVLESALFPEGASGGLVAVISPNQRAVSVKVDSVIGVAGFVKPGSRVDVLATLRRVDQEKALPTSKVILEDVRVLAVDQQLEEAREGEPEVVNVVTLEVDPEQAEHLIYAAHEGRVQLALRSPGDDERVPTRGVGVAEVLGVRGSPRPKGKLQQARVAQTTVQVIKGGRMSTRTFDN